MKRPTIPAKFAATCGTKLPLEKAVLNALIDCIKWLMERGELTCGNCKWAGFVSACSGTEHCLSAKRTDEACQFFVWMPRREWPEPERRNANAQGISIETTSLELSKRLREAGAKQESGYRWGHDDVNDRIALMPSDCVLLLNEASAFTLAEMLERVRVLGAIRLYLDRSCAECTWPNAPQFQRQSPTEAVGLLYEWALKEGVVKE